MARPVTTPSPSGSGNHTIVEYDLRGLATTTIDLNGIVDVAYGPFLNGKERKERKEGLFCVLCALCG